MSEFSNIGGTGRYLIFRFLFARRFSPAKKSQNADFKPIFRPLYDEKKFKITPNVFRKYVKEGYLLH